MNPASAQKRIAFGYNRDGNKIVINAGQAACVKLIFNYYAEGKSLSEIKNKADFFTVMSARATLVAAIILNLTFFAKLAIAAGLMFGALMLGSQALIILLLR